MRVRTLPTLLLISVLWTSAWLDTAHAQDSSGTPNIPPASSSMLPVAGKAIGVNVTNAIVNFINDSKQLEVDLEWRWLPAAQSLRAPRRTGMKFETHRFSFSNQKLRSGPSENWASDIKDKKVRGALEQALFPLVEKPDLSKFTRAASNRAFAKVWSVPPSEASGAKLIEHLRSDSVGAGLRKVLERNVSAQEYYGLLREHYVVTTLLGSQGARWSVEVLSSDRQKLIKVLNSRGKEFKLQDADRDIEWHIEMVEVPVEEVTPGSHKKPLAFYRFGISAVIHGVKLFFKGVDTDKVALRLKVGFDPDDPAMLGVDSALTSNTGDVAVQGVVKKDDLTTKEASYESAELEWLVELVSKGAGSSAKGFLGGGPNTSIVAGTLFGKDTSDTFVGINKEYIALGSGSARGFFGRATLGGLLGVVPGDSNALYLGPSFRTSIFTFSAGLRVGESESGGRIVGGPAGLLSLDLSRAFGGKRDVVHFNYANRDDEFRGSEAIKSSDDLAKNLTLVLWHLKKQPELELTRDEAKAVLKLLQMRDRSNAELTSIDRRTELQWPLDAGTQGGFSDVKPYAALQFIPVGYYAIQGLPSTLELVTDDPVYGPLPVSPLQAITDTTYTRKDWSLRSSANRESATKLKLVLDYCTKNAPLEEDLSRTCRLVRVKTKATDTQTLDPARRFTLEIPLEAFVEKRVIERTIPSGVYMFYAPSSRFQIKGEINRQAMQRYGQFTVAGTDPFELSLKVKYTPGN